ncbi:NUDIX hydrolase [Clostridium tunisiense]|uniref:NUDIX hydrolase n=1 Tax=Clostridium tunisiense TaxID=219748 RepID=UPI00031E77AC|nr:NUDIX hydrolase [Clostridium tunisiense]
MQGYNVIVVYDNNCEKLLMCKRRKEPYKGLLNLVGGKIQANEEGLEAAYRELEEETGISRRDINLTHLMDFTYYIHNCYLEVYVGKLNREFKVFEDENELLWTNFNNDFFDMTQFAGEGNIGHIIEHVKMSKDILLR